MFALFLARALCEDSDEIKLLNIGKAGEIAIPVGSLVFLTLLSIILYFVAGRHLDDDVPLDKIMILDDMSGSGSVDDQTTSSSKDQADQVDDGQPKEQSEGKPVIIDEL